MPVLFVFQDLIGFVATENVEDVKGLAGVIELKANPPLADPQSILRGSIPARRRTSPAPSMARRSSARRTRSATSGSSRSRSLEAS